MKIRVGEVEIKKILNGEEIKLKLIGELIGEPKNLRRELYLQSDEFHYHPVTFRETYGNYRNILLSLWNGMKIRGKEFVAVKIDDDETAEKVKQLAKKLVEEHERINKEFKEKEEKEFKEFMESDNYFKEPLKVTQGLDTGKFYVTIDNEKINEFVEKALNKFLAGVIFNNWYPDYYFPPASAKYTIEELVKIGKAEIKMGERGEYLVLSHEVVNELVRMLKEEIKEKERKEEERIAKLREKISREGRAVIERYVSDCCDPEEDCDLDVHELIAFKNKEDALKVDKNARWDEKLQAWIAYTWYHTY